MNLMHYNIKRFYLLLTFVLGAFTVMAQDLVSNVEELKAAIKKAKPGTVITMKDGVWKDVEIKFKGEGTEQEMIKLTAQTPGQVFIEGSSNLRLSGKYLEVSGLVFQNGFTPTSSVISFRTSSKDFAYNCRVTNCVVNNFSNPERYEADYWIELYGKNNLFDHNTIFGKRNKGVTLAVRLNKEEGRENGHVIENNYFGPRQNLGSNGGETIRIGTSHYSLSNSNTIVRNNYFEECSGELEIVSNKSCGNTYQGNVFQKCMGTLTMRHGHHTLVENNYFLGERAPNTGGIRVINEYQTVRNNYISGLTGYRFRGALVVMNGVPNSPINRYNQVVDSKIENNILVDCDHIQLCAGSDDERSATPIGTTFTNNVLMTKSNADLFTIYDDVSGITFKGNIVNEEVTVNPELKGGFKSTKYSVAVNEAGLLAPKKSILKKAGIKNELVLPVQKSQTGADYFEKVGLGGLFNIGQVIKVAPGTNTIIDAYKSSKEGDILVLENGQEYILTKYLSLSHTITIKTEAGEKAVIKSEKPSFFKIENEGALSLSNVELNGALSPDNAGNSVISTSRYSMNRNYKLFVKDCDVKDMNVNHSFHFLKSYASTMADSIVIENSNFENVTGNIFSLISELEDLGRYNAEYVVIANSTFSNIGGVIADVYRGGTDESTFGPNVQVRKCQFDNVGKSKKNKVMASFKFHGVQQLYLTDCAWKDSAPVNVHLTNGEPISIITNCSFENTPELTANRKEDIKIIN